MTSTPKKRGQLSLDEEKYIRDNIQTLTVEQIAESLNRNVAPIKRYISETKNYIVKPFGLKLKSSLMRIVAN